MGTGQAQQQGSNGATGSTMNGGTQPIVSDSRVDLSSLLGALDVRQLDFLPESPLKPGEPLRFAWRARIPWRTWSSADLELVLDDDGGQQRLYSRMNMAWPPSVNSHLDVWPPTGYVPDGAVLVRDAREALYTGFGDKNLILRLTVRSSDGGSLTLEDRATVSVIEEQARLRVSLIRSRLATWGSIYWIVAELENPADAAMLVEVSVAGDDGSTFPNQTVHLAAHARRTVTVGSSTHTWQWVDKPEYHVRPDALDRNVVYSVSAIWTDEFGNAYGVRRGDPITTNIFVPMDKIQAANNAEADWYLFLSFTVLAAAAGLVAALAPLAGPLLGGEIAIPAGIAAAELAGAATLAQYAQAQYAQLADDPPSPDQTFWTFEMVPTLDEETGFGSLSRFLSASAMLATLQLAASKTVGRVLGARISNDLSAIDQQTRLFEELRSSAIALVRELPKLAAEAIRTCEADPSFKVDNVRSLVRLWQSQANKSSNAPAQPIVAIDAKWRRTFDRLDPGRIPAIVDLLRASAVSLASATGAAFTDLAGYITLDQSSTTPSQL